MASMWIWSYPEKSRVSYWMLGGRDSERMVRQGLSKSSQFIMEMQSSVSYYCLNKRGLSRVKSWAVSYWLRLGDEGTR
jgi:hypothetical protein